MKRHITLLNNLNVTVNGRPSRIMNSAKGSALLAYLLITNQAQGRDIVADLLWEATSTQQSRQRLRELLGRVRKWWPDLQITRQTVGFQEDDETFIDLFVIRKALPTDDWARLDAALQLYTGDLLSSFYLTDTPRFNEWLIIERERLRTRVFDAYRRLLDAYFAQQQWQRGITAARRWLALDDLNEEAYQRLMRLLVGNGQFTEALQQYENCRHQLEAELGIEPQAALQKLARQIHHDNATSIAAINKPELPSPNVLSEPGALPGNAYLPYHRNRDFIGRKNILLQLAQQLLPWPDAPTAASRVTAVTGMGGLGKTQLAVEFAYRYGRYYPGGVFWISFAAADTIAEEVAMIGTERCLRLFQADDQLPLSDQVGRVQRAWQEPLPRLLIFDNCEDEDLLATWLPVTGGCRVLLTSQRAVWSRELHVHTIMLPLLTPQESSDYLQHAAPHVTVAEAAEIGHEVGFLPLALHLAGAFLQRYRQVQPSAYLQQLRDKDLLQHPSLKGWGSSHSPTGHELDVIRTFTITVQRLNPAEKRGKMAWQLLAHAACFAAGEPIPQALLLDTVVPTADDLMSQLLVADGLNHLISLSFLKVGAGETIVMHRLLVAFIIEITPYEAAPYPQKEIVQTAVESKVVQTISAYGAKKGHLSTLPVSAIHLRHITEVALCRESPLAAQLAVLLGRHLINIGNYDEAERILQRANQAAAALGDTNAQAQVLMALAFAQEHLGHDQDSLSSGQQAVALLSQAPGADQAKLAEALYRQGWAHFRLGQAEPALQAAHKGLAISEAEDIRNEIARCLNLMGVVNYYLLGKYAQAATQLEAGLKIYEELGYRSNQASMLNNMGENARLQGDFSLAASFYEKALQLAREIKNQNRAILFLSNLCGAYVKLGEYDTAVTNLEDLVNKTRTDWFGLSEAYRFLAEAYLGQGKPKAALATAQQALSLAQSNNPPEIGRAWRVLGLVAADLKAPLSVNSENTSNFYDATSCFRQSISYFEDLELERDCAITLWHWAQVEMQAGNHKQAKDMWQEARAIFQRLNLPFYIAHMEA